MILSIALFLVSVVSWIPFADKTSTVAATDGVPIHYSVQGKGEPALVFIHCGGCDSKVWENQVPVFAKQYRVVTIDLPGHGESGQDRKNWSIEAFADDVNTVITKLKLNRVVLIGSSMGGTVAVEATTRMPDRVLAVVPVDVLQNVEYKLPPEQLAEAIKQLRADYKTAMTGFLNQFLFSPNTPVAVKNRIISEVTSRPPELAVRILEGIMSYDAAPAFGKIKVPIRAINSDLNPTNLEVNRKYAPQFDVAIIKGTGHYPMLEAPEQFNELLAKVLRDLPAQRK